MTRRRGWLGAIALGLVVLLDPARAAAQPPAPRLEVHYIDVGQGDATLVRCPDNLGHMIIDSGELNSKYPHSADMFQAYINREFATRPKRIDVVVASHPHSDHIGSLEWLLQNFTVGTYVDNGQKGDTATWSRLDKLVRQRVKNGQLQYVNGKKKEFTEVDFCPGVKLEVMAPWAIKNLSDTNDRSVLVRLTFLQRAFLWVGDAHKTAENLLLTKLSDEQRARLDVDVLKVGHHGSLTSTGAGFVNTVSPAVVVVSAGTREVGSNATFKHPRWTTMQTLLDYFKQVDKTDHLHPAADRIWVFETEWGQRQRRRGLCLTAKDGSIVIRSDGNKIDVAADACRPQQ